MLFGGEKQISDNLFSELDDNHKKTFREWISALIDRLKKLFSGNKTAENEITKLEAKFEEMLKESLKSEAPGEKSTVFSFSGWTSDGVEVYETSQEIMNLTWNERKAKYLDVMKNEYRGRTAKFERNGHTYYAEFDSQSLRKPIYGDSRSSKEGTKALIKAGADGDIFNLVENSQYIRSKPNTKDHTDADYFDYFVKTVQIDGKVFDLIADVEKTYGGDGGYVYTLALTENKKIKASTTHGLTPVKGVVNASNKNISQGNDIVNTPDEKTSKNLGASLSYTPAIDEQELTRMAREGEITTEEYGRRMLEMRESKSADDPYTIVSINNKNTKAPQTKAKTSLKPQKRHILTFAPEQTESICK